MPQIISIYDNTIWIITEFVSIVLDKPKSAIKSGSHTQTQPA